MTLHDQAMERFQAALERARNDERIIEPTAMTLATALPDGHPSARTVLLKQVDRRGFVFYTNTLSRKGRQLAANPRAALVFLWAPLAEQVLVEGDVEPVTAEEADAYFRSRPRLSQIGAWASEQSQPLDDRETLVRRVEEFDRRYGDDPIPRPPHWSGYRVRPDLIEFWAGKAGRLHERDRYWHEAGEWRHTLLNP
jgi:pyridoxamine 5'-phosphate oxidase